MSKKDYREKIEEHRQSIEIEEDTKTRLTRSQRRKKKKSKETSFLTFLTVLLIGIPLAILIYVWGFWEPKQEEVTVEKEEGLIEVERNVEASNVDNEQVVKKETQDEEKIEKNKEVANNDKKEETSSKKVSNTTSEPKQTNSSSNQSKQNSSSSNQQKEKISSSQQSEVKIHKVTANDTLYSIAKKNYSDPTKGVEKIKAANNLSSDVITPGQELIIP